MNTSPIAEAMKLVIEEGEKSRENPRVILSALAVLMGSTEADLPGFVAHWEKTVGGRPTVERLQGWVAGIESGHLAMRRMMSLPRLVPVCPGEQYGLLRLESPTAGVMVVPWTDATREDAEAMVERVRDASPDEEWEIEELAFKNS